MRWSIENCDLGTFRPCERARTHGRLSDHALGITDLSALQKSGNAQGNARWCSEAMGKEWRCQARLKIIIAEAGAVVKVRRNIISKQNVSLFVIRHSGR